MEDLPRPEAAFLPGPRVTLSPTVRGPLSSLRFAAKDLMDVAGARKTSGNPDWARTHPPATRTAWAVQRLVDRGATLVGKTVTDELGFSLEGDNVHYGAPLNPRCPDRVTGGSSSGSASAVATAQVDFALGTDTGGSVRVPCSFCGVFGLRPTHGQVPLDGVTPLAPTLDTVGWMARDGATLQRVGRALLGESPPTRLEEFQIVSDAFALMDPGPREALRDAARSLLGSVPEVRLLTGRPELWSETYRLVQGGEAWSIHGPWIRAFRPTFAPDIQRRWEDASRLSPEEVHRASGARSELVSHVGALLPPGGGLVVPSAPCTALPRDRIVRAQESPAFRRWALAIGTIAGLGGFPQVSLPIAEFEGRPLGLGIVAPRGADGALLELAASADVRALVR